MRYVSVFYIIQTNAGCSTFVLTTLNIGKLFSGRYTRCRPEESLPKNGKPSVGMARGELQSI